MPRSEALPDNIYIVGCGGVTSWLLPVLIRLIYENDPNIHLMDGDKLEPKNLDRQLFSVDDIGKFKAEALLARYTDDYVSLYDRNEYLVEGTEVEPHSLYLGCADNHTARRNILTMVDNHGGRAIIGGNEYTDAEAYVYEPPWKGSPLDPRVFYPDILTDTDNDPARPASCQGIAQQQTPQLVLANSSAANAILWLFWFYYFEKSKMPPDSQEFWPLRHSNTFSRFSTTLVGQQKREPIKTKPKEKSPTVTAI